MTIQTSVLEPLAIRVFANPVGAGSLWFDNLATADGTPVAYDPRARAFVPMTRYAPTTSGLAVTG